ncbi:DUF6174 domain-containing protein [Undibacterium squillarum]|uniref:DUF6174 domain-containing protein n=1 Tax=Undibacterium squillarum TaxID=1131567 RepID=UPI0016757422|nr:DUF6174 domain-containing protein [Undibacterium squillarum]
MTIFAHPDCSKSGDAFPSRTVEVINSVVVSVYVPEWKQYMDVDKTAFKMENLFDEVSNIVLTKPQVFTKSAIELKSVPAFHSQYGFPESVFIDKTKGQCDEYLITVSDFKRL